MDEKIIDREEVKQFTNNPSIINSRFGSSVVKQKEIVQQHETLQNHKDQLLTTDGQKLLTIELKQLSCPEPDGTKLQKNIQNELFKGNYVGSNGITLKAQDGTTTQLMQSAYNKKQTRELNESAECPMTISEILLEEEDSSSSMMILLKKDQVIDQLAKNRQNQKGDNGPEPDINNFQFINQQEQPSNSIYQHENQLEHQDEEYQQNSSMTSFTSQQLSSGPIHNYNQQNSSIPSSLCFQQEKKDIRKKQGKKNEQSNEGSNDPMLQETLKMNIKNQNAQRSESNSYDESEEEQIDDIGEEVADTITHSYKFTTSSEGLGNGRELDLDKSCGTPKTQKHKSSAQEMNQINSFAKTQPEKPHIGSNKTHEISLNAFAQARQDDLKADPLNANKKFNMNFVKQKFLETKEKQKTDKTETVLQKETILNNETSTPQQISLYRDDGLSPLTNKAKAQNINSKFKQSAQNVLKSIHSENSKFADLAFKINQQGLTEVFSNQPIKILANFNQTNDSSMVSPGGGPQTCSAVVAPDKNSHQFKFKSVIEKTNLLTKARLGNKLSSTKQNMQLQVFDDEGIEVKRNRHSAVDIDRSSKKLLQDVTIDPLHNSEINQNNAHNSNSRKHKSTSFFLDDISSEESHSNKNEDESARHLRNHDRAEKRSMSGLAQLKYYDECSLFIFQRQSKFRQLCSIILHKRYFNYFILLTLLINCTFLAFYDNHPLMENSSINKTIDRVNEVLTVIYAIELFMKCVYRGLILHKKAYLRQGWNLIDLIVVLTGIIEIFMKAQEAGVIRILRVIFRPLKIFNAMSSLKGLLRSFLDALPDFANVGAFMIFVFTLFATMGVQQYEGALYNQCRYSPYPDNLTHTWPADLNSKRVCSLNDRGNFQCPEGTFCGNIETYHSIPLESEEIFNKAYINFGVTNFDNLGSSMLTVFQMITSETWYYQIVNLMDVDFPFLGGLYCFGVIIVGQFFLLNLILAIIIEAFLKSHKEKLQIEIERIQMIENQGYAFSSGNTEEYYDEEVKDDESFDDELDASPNLDDSNRRMRRPTHRITMKKSKQLSDREGAVMQFAKMGQKTFKEAQISMEYLQEIDEEENDDEELKTDEDLKDYDSQDSDAYNNRREQPCDDDLEFDEMGINGDKKFKSQNKSEKTSLYINSKSMENQVSPKKNFKKQQTMKEKRISSATKDADISKRNYKKQASRVSGKSHKSSKSRKKLSVGANIQRQNLLKARLEEMRKEENNQRDDDFTAFLKEPAQKRKIANMFTAGKTMREGKFAEPLAPTLIPTSQGNSASNQIDKDQRDRENHQEKQIHSSSHQTQKEKNTQEDKSTKKEPYSIEHTERNYMVNLDIENDDEEEFKDILPVHINSQKKLPPHMRTQQKMAQSRDKNNRGSFIKVENIGEWKKNQSMGAHMVRPSMNEDGLSRVESLFDNEQIQFGRDLNFTSKDGVLQASQFSQSRINTLHSRNSRASNANAKKDRGGGYNKFASNLVESILEYNFMKESGQGASGLSMTVKQQDKPPNSGLIASPRFAGFSPSKKKSSFNRGTFSHTNNQQSSSIVQEVNTLLFAPNTRQNPNIKSPNQLLSGLGKGLNLGIQAALQSGNMNHRASKNDLGDTNYHKNSSSIINLQANGLIAKLRNRIMEHLQQNQNLKGEASPENGSPNENNNEIRQVNVKEMGLVDLLSKKFQFEVKKNMVSDLRKLQTQRVKIKHRRDLNQIFDYSFKIQDHKLFKLASLMILLFNLLVQSLDSAPLNISLNNDLEILNFICFILFSLEFGFKIIGFGLVEYFNATKYHYFECFIVVQGFVDAVITFMILDEEQRLLSEVITVLKAFRILRIFKLARFWQGFQLFLDTLMMTIKNIASFFFLLFIVVFIYTLLGMELFAYKAHINHLTLAIDQAHGHSPMFNFDNFLDSLFSVFLILLNDGQSVIFYNYYRAVSGPLATLFWISFVIFAQKILLNMFLAMLLQNFQEGSIKQEIEKSEKKQLTNEENNASLKFLSNEVKQQLSQRFLKIYTFASLFLKKQEGQTDDLTKDGQEINNENSSIITTNKNHEENNIQQSQGPKMNLLVGKSLSFLGHNSLIRKRLYILITSQTFNRLIVLCILVSAIQLAIDVSIANPNAKEKKALFWIDLVTIIVFTIEALLKILVYGIILNGQHSYLRDTWNILDIIILVFSYICLSPLDQTFKFVKTLRILRSLRLVGKNEGLKVALRALYFAIPNILMIAWSMLLFFLIFAVICVSFFKGKMYHCVGNEHLSTTLYTKWDCLNAGGVWNLRSFDWDNMFNALSQLFIMATTAGWGEMLIHMNLVTGVDQIPIESETFRRPVWIVFHIFFMIVGFFFFINLFIGVVINTFHSEQARVGGSELLTDKQKEWIDLRLLVLRSAPLKKVRPPKGILRFLCFKIVENPYFEKFIQVCIFINTVVLMIRWYRQPEMVTHVTEFLNLVFTLIFAVEAIIKLSGLGFSYFKEGWNVFDFIIAIGSLAGLLVSQNTEIQIKWLSLLRSFRILRLLRLLKRGGKSLYLIFNTFIITLQSLANIGGLLILILYIYSVMGVILFGDIMRNGNMNDYINFETFTSAFIALFTVCTTDSWNYTVGALTKERSILYQCENDPTYEDYVNNGNQNVGCGNRTVAYLFFISYYFLVALVFLKLFIAIILNGYLMTLIQDTRLFNNDKRERFRQIWAEFDPDATTFIKLAELRPFLFALGEPLGFDQSYQESKYLQDKFIASLELPTYHVFKSYQFLDVLDALSFRLMVQDHINKILEEEEDLLEAIQNQMQGLQSVERDIKEKIEKEVNKLIFQKQSENILAFKELFDKEQRKKRNQEKNKDQTGLTSSHHMAIEAAIRRIKNILAKKRQEREERARQELQLEINRLAEQQRKENIRYIPGSD